MTLDTSVMNVSIATVAEDLGTTVTGVQTAITLYTLVMASLMVLGGKVGSIMGRKRAFSLGCIIYGCGSMTTALSPNLTVLIIGWSFLEGFGAVLIMPAIVALVAGNFPPEARPKAYGLVAAAGAIAIAVGPVIGGFMTTYFSWRYVFAGEVLIVLAILVLARRAADSPVEQRPHLDLIGAVIWAAGLALFVLGVLKSSEWGWILPKAGATSLFGLSLTFWFIIAGLFLLWLFFRWQRRLERTGKEPLIAPALLRIRQLTGGLITFLFQFLIMAGVFFIVPLFLSVVLGLSPMETGLRLRAALAVHAGRRDRHPALPAPGLAATGGAPRPAGAHRRHPGADRGPRGGGRFLHRVRSHAHRGSRHGGAGVATRQRDRLGGAHRAELRGRRAAEHRQPARLLHRHGPGGLGADRRPHDLVPHRDPAEPQRAGGGEVAGQREPGRGRALHLPERPQAQMTAAGASADLTNEVVDQYNSSQIDGLRAALAVLAVMGVIALFFTGRIPKQQPGSAPV